MSFIINVYLVFYPVPGADILKLLKFPLMRATKVSFVMLTRLQLESTYRWGLVARTSNLVIGELELSVACPDLWRWRAARDCICCQRPMN